MFMLWSAEDEIFASPETFKTEAKAEAFAKQFRKRFAAQGYYLTVRGERIAPSDVELVVVPADS